LKRFFIPYIYIVFFLWNFSAVFSQNLTLKISVKDSLNNPFIESLNYQQKHPNLSSLFSQIDSLKIGFEKIGFLSNSLDTIITTDSIYLAHFTLGKSNKIIRIFYDKNSIDKKLLFQISKNISDNYFDIKIEDTSKALNYLANQFENQGNSFTKINLSNINFENDIIVSKLNVKKFETRTINKVIINGFENFPQKLIKHHFNINSKTVFSKDKIAKISNKLKILPFVSEVKPADVLFTNDSTYIYLYLKKKKANLFDGLIGFSSDENNSSLKFNGYLDLTLNNIFNNGEVLSLNWKNNSNDRQFFEFSAEIPYIFNSPITPTIGLNIYKQDSTFINTKTNLELGYNINYNNKVSAVYISENSTNLLDNPISDIVSYKSNFYGVSYNYIVLNNSLLFPTKFNFGFEVFLGSRKSNNNTTKQSKFNFNTNYLWSLNFKNHIYLQNNSSILISDNILTNELFRIGGINSIRGFNEESIFASLYSIAKIEYRYAVNSSSYIFSISDLGYIEDQLNNTSQKLYSLGLGYAFSTKFGLLNLSYAVGKSNNQSFELSNSRFHVKISSFF